MPKKKNDKVYTVPEEPEKAIAPGIAPAKKRTLPEALRKNLWKPGHSGNPIGGRPKSVTTEIRKHLSRKVPGDRRNRTYLEKLVVEMVDRAMRKSDVLMKEILDRVEGKVPADPAEAAQYGVKIIIADIPGPPGEFNQFIDIVPPKHPKNYGSFNPGNGNKPKE